MTGVRAGAALALVLVAALCGTIGTGLIFTALADHAWGAMVWGLPLALAGLYWCGRALAQGQRSLRRRRVAPLSSFSTPETDTGLAESEPSVAIASRQPLPPTRRVPRGVGARSGIAQAQRGSDAPSQSAAIAVRTRR